MAFLLLAFDSRIFKSLAGTHLVFSRSACGCAWQAHLRVTLVSFGRSLLLASFPCRCVCAAVAVLWYWSSLSSGCRCVCVCPGFCRTQILPPWSAPVGGFLAVPVFLHYNYNYNYNSNSEFQFQILTCSRGVGEGSSVLLCKIPNSNSEFQF